MYGLIVLIHVAAMLGLFGTLAIEGLALRSLRRVVSYEQAREWTAAWRLLPAIGAPSLLLSLASGVYLAGALDLWEFTWTQVSVPTLVIIAIAGGVTGPRVRRLHEAIGLNNGPLPEAVVQQVRSPSLPTSWTVRTALMLALVVDMIMKPHGAIQLIVFGALLGLTLSAPLWMRTPSGRPGPSA